MTEAAVLVCPSCGAGVVAGERHCRHCDAPIATVRCATCFEMNARDAAHCTGCGRDLGLEPIPHDGTLECPDGHGAMVVLDVGPGMLHDCAECGGQFVEASALRQLIEQHDRVALVPFTRAPTPSETAVARVHYLACPVCKALMNRRNFGATSGVIVDICAKHGTWFDTGELPRVLAYAERGGLGRKKP